MTARNHRADDAAGRSQKNAEASQSALTYAASLARDTGAVLLIVHASQLEQYPVGDLFDEDPQPSDEELAELRAVKAPDPRISCEHRLLYGAPAEEIVKLADQEGVEAIVIGTPNRDRTSAPDGLDYINLRASLEIGKVNKKRYDSARFLPQNERSRTDETPGWRTISHEHDRPAMGTDPRRVAAAVPARSAPHGLSSPGPRCHVLCGSHGVCLAHVAARLSVPRAVAPCIAPMTGNHSWLSVTFGAAWIA
ncbi:MAG TPA: universal stress protein [Pirellulales bacterium]|nr:universal stress protein [Pirellulales bacterium]